ncbi:MAG: hypothetical protein COA50_10085 [Flavobacteriaceae bacterium]|nr:MAG: hypothetical protein COA50_10085 [Flavobacteriaceae bacterium]
MEKVLKQLKFEKAREEYTDREIKMETLFSNKVLLEATIRNGKNIYIITVIVVIWIILSLVGLLLITMGII